MTWPGSRTFRDLHSGPAPLLLPNAWDVASALVLVADGCPAIGTTSLGIAAAAGRPDAARAVRALTAELADRLATLPVPVSADLEDGFADEPQAVADLVAELPVAGINLEDSTGGRLVDPRLHAAKVAAVKERCPEVFLNVRVDTFWLGEHATTGDTLRRAERYVEAGADGVFVPGRLTEEQIRGLTAALNVPVNVLATSDHTVPRLAELGVRRISTGSLLFRVALDEAAAVVRRLRAGQPAPGATTYGELNALVAAHDARQPGRPL